jgi:hypothetical protein
MKRLITSLLLGIVVPVAVALMIRDDYQSKLAEMTAVMVQVQAAEIQSDKTSAKGLKQIALQASYVAFGQHYSWSTVLPLASSQNEKAFVLVDAAKSKGDVKGWVRKVSPEKLILFLPDSPLNLLTYFFLMLIGLAVASMSMLAGAGWTSRDSHLPSPR